MRTRQHVHAPDKCCYMRHFGHIFQLMSTLCGFVVYAMPNTVHYGHHGSNNMGTLIRFWCISLIQSHLHTHIYYPANWWRGRLTDLDDKYLQRSIISCITLLLVAVIKINRLALFLLHSKWMLQYLFAFISWYYI